MDWLYTFTVQHPFIIISLCIIILVLLGFRNVVIDFIFNHFSFFFVLFLFLFVGLILFIVHILEIIHPSKSTYEYVQEFREKQDYYIKDGSEWVDDIYGIDDDGSFSEQDMEDAYNAGLDDGIEQTIEYYESLEDDDFF